MFFFFYTSLNIYFIFLIFFLFVLLCGYCHLDHLPIHKSFLSSPSNLFFFFFNFFYSYVRTMFGSPHLAPLLPGRNYFALISNFVKERV
jgi:hypothetical protein